jgi:hypothetical protein
MYKDYLSIFLISAFTLGGNFLLISDLSARHSEENQPSLSPDDDGGGDDDDGSFESSAPSDDY